MWETIQNLLLLLFRWLEDLERAQQRLVNAHHSTCIVELAAVVGRREESDKLALGEEFVTIFDDLMCATDEVHVMLLQEPRDHIRTEGERDTTIVLRPASDILIGIGPQQVTEQTAVGDLDSQHMVN